MLNEVYTLIGQKELSNTLPMLIEVYGTYYSTYYIVYTIYPH